MNKKYVVFHQLNQNPKLLISTYTHKERKKGRKNQQRRLRLTPKRKKQKKQQQISKAADKMGACKVHTKITDVHDKNYLNFSHRRHHHWLYN